MQTGMPPGLSVEVGVRGKMLDESPVDATVQQWGERGARVSGVLDRARGVLDPTASSPLQRRTPSHLAHLRSMTPGRPTYSPSRPTSISTSPAGTAPSPQLVRNLSGNADFSAPLPEFKLRENAPAETPRLLVSAEKEDRRDSTNRLLQSRLPAAQPLESSSRKSDASSSLDFLDLRSPPGRGSKSSPSDSSIVATEGSKDATLASALRREYSVNSALPRGDRRRLDPEKMAKILEFQEGGDAPDTARHQDKTEPDGVETFVQGFLAWPDQVAQMLASQFERVRRRPGTFVAQNLSKTTLR